MPGLGSGRGVSMDTSTTTQTAEVLYVLSRGGQLEHPHMISVPYAQNQPGPTLKDVKARLVALRGRGMPGSFSWSYKRNYKESFIWCDLFDDDCILPLSATGEYVLKAMELFDVDEGMEQLTSTGKPEHRHVVSDVSMAIKKSLLLINNTPGDVGVDQIMKSLTYSTRRGTSIEVDSSSCTDERTESENQSGRIAIAARDDVTSADCREVLESSLPTPAKRRTWEKEMDTSTICTQLVHHRKSSPDVDRGGDSEDPFFFGVLRKATRLGSSFRPRLCRGVDVMDSTRFKTKLQFRSKSTKHDSDAVVVPASRPVKEFKTLSEYFDSPALQLKQLTSSNDSQPAVKEEVIVPDPVVVAPSTPSSRRPFGNEALDASYRKTMEVLTKLPTSRGSCRIHTLPTVQSKGGVIVGAQKVISRSDSTRTSSPMKQSENAIDHHHEPCSIHGMESAPLKQRPSKGSDKPKGSSTSAAGFEASTARAKAVVKSTSAERTRRSSSRSASKESSANSSQDRMEVIPPGNINKHDSESKSTSADVASCNDQGGRGWPFDQPARPRDFQTREDRPLTPGLSSMDWEKSLDSVIGIDQPVDLVLHECSQCGRTFKLDSLQVHMRGCRGVSKAKSSSHRKVSHQ